MTTIQARQQGDVVERQTLKKKPALTLQTIKKVSGNNNTIILADISGSMDGEKLTALKDALKKVWRPGLEGIAFNHELYELRQEDIDYLQADGTTDILEALREAWGKESGHIILITDGCPNSGPTDILKEAEFHSSTPIDTIGIGDGDRYSYDPEFLRKLSALTGGRFNAVNEPLMLTETLERLMITDSSTQEGAIQL